MFSRSRTVIHRRILKILLISSCITSFGYHLLTPSLSNEKIPHHKSVIYNLTDPFIMATLIDQFLNTKDFNERDILWSLLIQSCLNSFKIYFKRTETQCSISSSSYHFIHNYLNEYTKKLLLDNIHFQRHLTGFGLPFDYNPNKTRSQTHHILYNIFLSSCTYFELILLIIKVQFVLYELNIGYFIGRNTLLGARRHHDIVPWHSAIEFNLSLNNKEKLINNIMKRFPLVLEEVSEKQNGFIYKIHLKENIWPQIEIYFYQENSTEIFDSRKNEKSNLKIGYLKKTDVFPLHLRPFGSILISTMNNPQAMISNKSLNVCESASWNHRLRRATDIDHQWRIPCEQLYSFYLFVQFRYSRRHDYCEETLKTKRVPYRTLSYFRCTCQENITDQLIRKKTLRK